jgi:dTDP-4-amino-4,6-dideoxygalactose transaminase
MLRYVKGAWKRLASPTLPAHIWLEVSNSVRIGWWDEGLRVRNLEALIAKRMGLEPECVIATRSCTDALAAAWEWVVALDSTHVAKAPALTYGATYCWPPQVKLVDVDEDGWPTGPVDVGVELWGRPFPHACQILDSAYRLLAPEHGDRLRHEYVKAICYSFGVQKEAPCLIGGALVLSPRAAADRPFILDFLRCATRRREGMPRHVGIKGRMPDPVATMARMQIGRLGHNSRKRATLHKRYVQRLGKLVVSDERGAQAVIKLPTWEERQLVQEHLTKQGIETAVHYSLNENIQCPNALALSRRVLSLPLHPAMSEFDVLRVCRAVAGA